MFFIAMKHHLLFNRQCSRQDEARQCDVPHKVFCRRLEPENGEIILKSSIAVTSFRRYVHVLVHMYKMYFLCVDSCTGESLAEALSDFSSERLRISHLVNNPF